MKTNTFFSRISRAVKSISLLTVLAVGLVACGGGGGGGSYFEGGGNEGTGIKALEGIVIDGENGEFLPGTPITVYSDKSKVELETDGVGYFSTKLPSDVTSVTFQVGQAKTQSVPFSGAILSVVVAVDSDGNVTATQNEPPQIAEPSDPVGEAPESESKPRPQHSPDQNNDSQQPNPQVESPGIEASIYTYDTTTNGEPVYYSFGSGIEGLDQGTFNIGEANALYLQGFGRNWELHWNIPSALTEAAKSIDFTVAIRRNPSNDKIMIVISCSITTNSGGQRTHVETLEVVGRDGSGSSDNIFESAPTPGGEEPSINDAAEAPNADTQAPQAEPSPTPDARAPWR